MATTQRDGVRLAFETTGSGPPVLLVAGFAADATFWGGLAPMLAESFTVVTMDNRGVGRSGTPDSGYGVADMADDAAAVLDAAGLDGRVHVVGHSMGGSIALALARSRPQRVGHLVLAQSFARLGREATTVLTDAGHAYDDDPAPVAALADILFPWLFSPAFLDAPGVREELLDLSLANPTPQSRSGYQGQLRALTAFDAVPWLAEVEAPVLVIGASEDRLVSATDTADLAAGLPRAGTAEISGAGHCAPAERPAEIAYLIRGHLS